MFGVSGGELIILLVIGLVVLGPERLPRVANQIGGWLGQARRMTRVMKRQLEEELDLNDTLNIKPPRISREPSKQPSAKEKSPPDAESDTAEAEDSLPRDDDDYSPAHAADEDGTGVGEEIYNDDSDLEVTEIDRELVASNGANGTAESIDETGAEKVSS